MMKRLLAFLLPVLLFATAACTGVPSTEASLAEYRKNLREQRFNRLIVTVLDQRSQDFEEAWRTHRPIAFLVTAEDLRRQFIEDGRRIGHRHGLTLVDSYPVKSLGLYTLVYEADDQQTLQEAAAALDADERVESVTPVSAYRTRTRPPERFGDPLGTDSGGIEPATLQRLHAIANGQGIRIAVIDTGFDRDHEDLVERDITQVDFVNDGHDLAEEHGTAIAGLIAAVPDNGIGIRGIAPEASTTVFRACWQEAGDDAALCTSDTIAKSLAAALEMRPDVVNLSLTGPMNSLLSRLVEALVREGVIVIAASNPDAGDHFPASVPGVLPVSARADLEPADGLFMPGTGVITLLPGNRYASRDGASVSAAQVSGLAALFRQRNPSLGTAELRAMLQAASLPSRDAAALVNALELAGTLDDQPQLTEQTD